MDEKRPDNMFNIEQNIARIADNTLKIANGGGSGGGDTVVAGKNIKIVPVSGGKEINVDPPLGRLAAKDAIVPTDTGAVNPGEGTYWGWDGKFTKPVGDKGDPGTPGQAATITIEETITAGPGSNARFEEVEGSTAQNRKYWAYIPQGEKGDPGSGGDTVVAGKNINISNVEGGKQISVQPPLGKLASKDLITPADTGNEEIEAGTYWGADGKFSKPAGGGDGDYVPVTRNISAGAGLNGGGDLNKDIEIGLDTGSQEAIQRSTKSYYSLFQDRADNGMILSTVSDESGRRTKWIKADIPPAGIISLFSGSEAPDGWKIYDNTDLPKYTGLIYCIKN